MFKTVEDLQRIGRSQIEATSQSAAALARGVQQIAQEASERSKKSVEDSSAAFAKLFGVQTLDGAIQVQTDFARTSYEDVVASYRRFGELFASIAKDAYGPFETSFEQAQALMK